MAVELFSNSAQTTLNGNINSGVTSLAVVSATAFPSTGNFRILIDSELMLVTGVSGATFTVTRAIEGTSAASHNSGSTVTEVLTNGSFTQAMLDRSGRGTYTSRPAAGIAGRVYYSSDFPYVSYDDGAAWNTYCCGFPITEPPILSGFSWVNQNGATVSQLGGSSGPITLTSQQGNANNMNQQVLSAPATPYTLEAGFFLTLRPNTSNFPSGGILFRNSSSGKLNIMQVQAPNMTGLAWYSTFWTNSTTATSNGYTGLGIAQANLFWVRIADDGSTNRTYYVSSDSRTWMQIFQEGRTNNFTADQIGFGVNASTDPSLVVLTLAHWRTF
jgi:hypothetical protein